jgi:hypothetical protein
MKMNVGVTDRVIRLLLAAIVFTILYFTDSITEGLAISTVVLGLTMILTSILGFCPLYLPFGINTNRFLTPTKKETK